nr:hypothetical protein RC58_04920 [Mycobacterium avium subsp. paratuberculosis]
MVVDLRGVRAVLLPGTGSDDDYIHRAFSGPLAGVGAVLVAPPPRPDRLVAGYLEALNDAARRGPIAVGGVSIGAAVAAAWALAQLAARYSAARLRADGLAATTIQMRASSPAWLADELTRSWGAQWPHLPDAMEEAAGYVAPSRDELAGLTAPLAVAAALDDPIHPLQAGRDWVAAAPRAALRTVTLDQIGADPAALGAACLAALAEL